MVTPFDNVIAILQNIGFFDFYLPFLVTFAIFYGLLARAKIFGEEGLGKRINALLALVAAFYIMVYTPVGFTVSGFLSNMFGGAAMILVTVIIFGMIFATSLFVTLNKERDQAFNEKYQRRLQLILLGFGAAAAVALFITSGGLGIFGITVSQVNVPGMSLESMIGLIIIIFFLLLAYYATKEPKPPEEPRSRTQPPQ